MATIRCMDVADSAQFVVERSVAIVMEHGRSFVASLLESLRNARPRHPFGKSSGEGANAALTTKRSMRFGSSTREWPGFSFFVCRSKRSGLLRTKDEGVAALLMRVEGLIVDWWTAAYALFLCMDQRVAPPKCLWQMPVALQSEAAPRFGQWVQTGRTWKWWIDVGWWRNESTRFVL